MLTSLTDGHSLFSWYSVCEHPEYLCSPEAKTQGLMPVASVNVLDGYISSSAYCVGDR